MKKLAVVFLLACSTTVLAEEAITTYQGVPGPYPGGVVRQQKKAMNASTSSSNNNTGVNQQQNNLVQELNDGNNTNQNNQPNLNTLPAENTQPQPDQQPTQINQNANSNVEDRSYTAPSNDPSLRTPPNSSGKSSF